MVHKNPYTIVIKLFDQNDSKNFFFSDRERQVTMSNTEDIELMRTFTWPKVTLENVPKNIEAPIFKSRKRTRAHVALFKARDIFCKFLNLDLDVDFKNVIN